MKYERVNLLNTDQVIVTFGGGMGGCSNHYSYCQDIKVKGNVITFKGYNCPPSRKQAGLDCQGVGTGCFEYVHPATKNLMIFGVGFWPQHRIQNLGRCLQNGDMVNAMIEYRATDPNNEPANIPLLTITACNNWQLIQP